MLTEYTRSGLLVEDVDSGDAEKETVDFLSEEILCKLT